MHNTVKNSNITFISFSIILLLVHDGTLAVLKIKQTLIWQSKGGIQSFLHTSKVSVILTIGACMHDKLIINTAYYLQKLIINTAYYLQLFSP